MSLTPMVTVREKATGQRMKINLCDLDGRVHDPVIPSVAPKPVTKRDQDREIAHEVVKW